MLYTTLENNMYKINKYEVGGCVRDHILGIESDDIDYVIIIEPLNNIKITTDDGFQIMENYLNENKYKIFLKTKDMLTIRAKDPQTNKVADFVLGRKELEYDENSRKPTIILGTLYDDLERRDLTINAIAKDIDGTIIDYFGGVQDLENKILHTPIDPIKSLLDDPLRLLRVLRFSITKQCTINSELWDAMCNEKVLSKLFQTVSTDRIVQELTKSMKYDTSKFMKLLINFDNKTNNIFLDKIFDSIWLMPTTRVKK